MKIAVVTICTIDLNYGNYIVSNSWEYCNKHGYDFILYEDKLNPNTAVIANKTLAVIQNIDDYDWILMKDADSLFYNYNLKIENYIDNDYDYIASMSKIHNVVNLGHLLIKCTPQVKQELTMISQVVNKIVLKGEQPIYNDFWETGKISPVKKISKHIFNAHPFGKKDWHREWGLAKEDLGEWGRPKEELQELDDMGYDYHKRYGDINHETFIVHYPGTFMKTCSYVIERQVIDAGQEMFNFSEDYLPQFIVMYNNIRVKYLSPTLNKNKPKEISLKPRVKKTERRKIKYKNR